MKLRSLFFYATLSLLSLQTQAQTISKTEQLLTDTTRWIQTVLDSQNESMRVELLRIDDPSYRSFLAKRLEPEHRQQLGQVALSALYEPYGQRSGKKLLSASFFIIHNLNINCKSSFSTLALTMQKWHYF